MVQLPCQKICGVGEIYTSAAGQTRKLYCFIDQAERNSTWIQVCVIQMIGNTSSITQETQESLFLFLERDFSFSQSHLGVQLERPRLGSLSVSSIPTDHRLHTAHRSLPIIPKRKETIISKGPQSSESSKSWFTQLDKPTYPLLSFQHTAAWHLSKGLPAISSQGDCMFGLSRGLVVKCESDHGLFD